MTRDRDTFDAACCPCCGGPLPGEGMKWVADAHTLLTIGRVIRFTKFEARVFDALWLARSKGFGLSQQRLKERIYADDINGGAESNTVQQFALRIRRKLRGSPITIGAIQGNGYRIYVSKEVGAA